MTPLERTVDASFYNLIHQLAEDTLGGAAERRDDRRLAFQAVQRIAVDDGQGVPDASAFVEVQCSDLNRNGFSFLMREAPKFDALVAAFGAEPDAVYLAARVSHCADVLLHRSGVIEWVDGPSEIDRDWPADEDAPQPMVLIGCQFTQRVSR